MGVNKTVLVCCILILMFLISCSQEKIIIVCPDGSKVSDESLCTIDKKETAQKTGGTAASCPSSCDDSNSCTTDSCSSKTGFSCAHALIEGCEEKNILSVKAHEIIPSSSQVEAGYTLDRDYAGRVWFDEEGLKRVEKLGIVDSFIKGFYKDPDGENARWLYFYAYTFEDGEGAQAYFDFLSDQSITNYSYRKLKDCEGFEECSILVSTYKSDFINQKKFVTYVREKNAVVEIVFTSNNDKISDAELNAPLEKLKMNLKNGAPEASEVPLDKVSNYASERQGVDVSVLKVTKGLTIPKASEYRYYDLDEELSPSGDAVYKFIELRIKNTGVNDDFTIEGTAYHGFYLGPESFSLEDEKGDVYSTHTYTYYLDGFETDVAMPIGKEIRTRLAYLVPKNEDSFTLYAYDWEGTQVAKVLVSG